MRKSLLVAFAALSLASSARAQGDAEGGFVGFGDMDKPAPPAAPSGTKETSSKTGDLPPPAPVDNADENGSRERKRAARQKDRDGESTASNTKPASTPVTPPAPVPAPAPATPPAPSQNQSPAQGGFGVANAAGKAVDAPAPAAGTPPLPKELVESVNRSMAAGDTKTAAASVRQALQADPENQRLKDLEKLLDRRVTATADPAALAKKASALMGGPADAGRVPAPALASAIGWPGAGADAATKAREAAAVPAASSDFLRRDLAQRGLAKMGMQDFTAAEEALTLKILQDPNDWLAYRLRALTRRNLKKPSAALDDAGKALEINPQDGWSQNIRSMALTDLHRYREASRAADAALALNPRDANAYAARAAAKDGLGRTQESLADLSRAAEIDPQFEALYRQALLGPAGAAGSGGRPWSGLPGKPLGQAAAGLGLLAAAGLLWRKRAALTTAVKALTGEQAPLMRAADRFASGRVDAPRGENAPGFRIVRELGQGGMGVVFEAFDDTLHRTVALKRLRDDLAGDARGRGRFLKEARLVASLKHPHIVEIHSIFEQDQGLFLVFEFVPGQSLDRVIAARALTPAEVLGVVRQAASALDYAHEHGVIHQDLKPANILVSEGLVKVTDFGIARRLSDATTTMSPVIMGTPPYMAPEQARGLHQKESDRYSLGLCAYEMLTRLRPFDDDPTFARRLAHSFQPASTLAPGLPPEADAVFDRILEPEPSKRHASATAFADDLARVLPRRVS